MMRFPSLLAGLAVALSAAACSVYGTNLVGSGGAGGSTGSTSSSTASSGSSGAMTPCSDVGQCPGMDTDCQQRACKGGFCQLDYATQGTAVSAQTKGDCQKLVCDGQGNTTSQDDDGDVPDSKNDCKTDSCMAGKPSTTDKSKSTACTSSGGALCDGAGQCVECLSQGDCPSGVCNTMHACVGAQCNDTKKNGLETDVDCGGTACPKCVAGKACAVDGDCVSMMCVGLVCAASCTDLAKDGQETDVDCGGGCPACASEKHCVANADCQSGSCVSGTCKDVLLISQVRTRGPTGGNDEFVELYNPTSVAVTFDTTWALKARNALGGTMNCMMNTLTVRFTGMGQVIPPHGHLLYVNKTMMPPYYSGTTPGDGTYATGVPDAAAVVLFHGSQLLDRLCFYYDAGTLDTLTNCTASPYGPSCEGTPVQNPFVNTTASNADKSLERLPGGAAGNAADTNSNAADFVVTTPSEPRNTMSPPTP